MADADYKAEPVVPDIRANIAYDRNSSGILFHRKGKEEKEQSCCADRSPINVASRKGAVSLRTSEISQCSRGIDSFESQRLLESKNL